MEELRDIDQLKEIIKKVRKKKKIRQKDLANFSNLSVFGISKLERKGDDVKLSTVLKLTNLLGIKVYIDNE